MTPHPPPSDEQAKPTLDTAPGAPKVGQRVRFGSSVGVVCEPNDPGRTGSYSSAKFGEIPIKLLGNRKSQRRAEAQARSAR